MSVFAAFVGSFVGFVTKLGMNAIQKKPWMLEPWEHLGFALFGGVTGAFYQKFKKQEKDGLRAILDAYGKQDIYAEDEEIEDEMKK